MIKAELTLVNGYGEALIPVEVSGTGPRAGTVWVRALNGLRPFTRFSMGGPYQDNSAIVLTHRLKNIHFETNFEPETNTQTNSDTEKEILLPVEAIFISPEDCQEEAFDEAAVS